MGAMASQITSLTIVYSSVYSGADQRKHQSSVSLVFVRGIHRSSVHSPHKGPVTRKKFPFDEVIMVIHSLHIQPQPTSHLIQLSQGYVTVILKVYFSNSQYEIVAWAFVVKLLSGHITPLMIN